KRDVEVIAILLPGTAVALPPGLPFVLVQDGAQEVANAYLLFRRTLSNPGRTVLGEAPSHMEFLLDRFGYLRARWLPLDDAQNSGHWQDSAFLLGEIDALNREPRILPPPDAHVH
ncbi:MAG: cytochrome C, partial [Sterolibacterium sp.]